ncbi:hypothetical protein M514_28074 [Trichuris suis]|uniref:Uncharacterized protein n=1 Tax=Trichuris suis TaxID=68888 RepID=A0A085MRA2_9BILA|nr:hypothetical protein M514_28074 [Trichuris suis]
MQEQPTYEKRTSNTDKDSYCNTFGQQHFPTRRREYYPEIKLELFMQLNEITQCHMQGNSEHVTPQTPGTAVRFKTT